MPPPGSFGKRTSSRAPDAGSALAGSRPHLSAVTAPSADRHFSASDPPGPGPLRSAARDSDRRPPRSLAAGRSSHRSPPSGLRARQSTPKQAAASSAGDRGALACTGAADFLPRGLRVITRVGLRPRAAAPRRLRPLKNERQPQRASGACNEHTGAFLLFGSPPRRRIHRHSVVTPGSGSCSRGGHTEPKAHAAYEGSHAFSFFGRGARRRWVAIPAAAAALALPAVSARRRSRSSTSAKPRGRSRRLRPSLECGSCHLR
jgi:hypothetical protein